MADAKKLDGRRESITEDVRKSFPDLVEKDQVALGGIIDDVLKDAEANPEKYQNPSAPKLVN